MKKDEYGIVKQRAESFSKKLLKIPQKEGCLTVSYPPFGSSSYLKNIKKMSKNYSHSQTGKKMAFIPATTSESIMAMNPDSEKYPELANYSFENFTKPEIFDPKWLHAGYIVRDQDGVYVNTKELNEKNLKNLIDKSEKINGIYILPNGRVEGVKDFAFAPYETFKTGLQNSGKFAEGGLARALEHTSEKVARNLKEISSSKFYKNGVNVWDFEGYKIPISKVVTFSSRKDLVDNELVVLGSFLDDYLGGFAFGVKRAVK